MSNNAHHPHDDSFLLAELKPHSLKILTQKKSNVSRYAASVSKVFLAAEFIRLLDGGKIKNKAIEIKKSDLAGYGTDILADLFARKNLIKVDALTLLGLMIKYSCNSSALVLAKYFLPKREELDKSAREIWGLKGSQLIDNNGKQKNYFSLQDFLIIFYRIYMQSGHNWNLLKEKLRTTRNIYYLFDQQELEILGAKSGTKKIGSTYYVHDCGIFRLHRKMYFIGAMVTDRSISSAVLRIREIGKKLITRL